jgi:hypothetical protein
LLQNVSPVPPHLRPRRDKIFGDGPRIPLDREAKVRIAHLARALKRRTEPRKHYGILTGKFVDVLLALLWLIHDGKSGQCNPAYATIADKAGCAPSTVGLALKALEAVGILSWVNRIHRVRDRERDLFGHWTTVWRVLRTSNAYVFHDPKVAEQQGRPSNTDFRCGPSDAHKKQPVIQLATSEPASGARLDGARVTQEAPPPPPSVPTEPPAIAPEGSTALLARTKLTPAERAALVARLDANPTRADWALYDRELDAMLQTIG